MTLHPAAPDTGIVFRRTDRRRRGDRAPTGAMRSSSRCARMLETARACRSPPSSISWRRWPALEIDNVLIEIDGPEVPVMDGSAAPFVFLIECAGVVEQDAPRRAIKVLKPVDRRRWRQDRARSSPDDGFSMSFAIDFASGAISRQDITIALDPESFKSDISRARTFGFLARGRSDARRRAGARRLARQRRGHQRRPRAQPRGACATSTSSCATRCSTRWAISTLPARR